MEYSLQSEKDETTLEIIQKNSKISQLTKEKQKDLADFLDTFTSNFIPAI